MKTWVNLCAIVLAAGVITGSAQTAAGTAVNTNEAVAPPSAPAPGPAPAPVPALPKVTPPPRTPVAPAPAPESHKVVETNPPPAPVMEVKPAEEEPAMPTNAVSTEGEGAAATPPANAGAPTEGSGIGHLSALLIGLVILLLGGGVGFYIWSRSGVVSHGSLITSAMNELKKNPPGEDKDEDKIIEPPADKPAEPREEKKKLEIKFPPPMT